MKGLFSFLYFLYLRVFYKRLKGKLSNNYSQLKVMIINFLIQFQVLSFLLVLFHHLNLRLLITLIYYIMVQKVLTHFQQLLTLLYGYFQKKLKDLVVLFLNLAV